VDIFENAFRKIKEATGVSDVNEVIQKIVSQESTTENLIAVTREKQGKIEALNQLRKQIKTHCEDIKYSGVGGGQHRKMVSVCCFLLRGGVCVHYLLVCLGRVLAYLSLILHPLLFLSSPLLSRWIRSRTSCPTAPRAWSAPASSTSDSARYGTHSLVLPLLRCSAVHFPFLETSIVAR